jgi:hypothetical protein
MLGVPPLGSRTSYQRMPSVPLATTVWLIARDSYLPQSLWSDDSAEGAGYRAVAADDLLVTG